MAIITSDDVEQHSSTCLNEPVQVEHQEALTLSQVNSEILEENFLQNEQPVGENSHKLSGIGLQLKSQIFFC